MLPRRQSFPAPPPGGLDIIDRSGVDDVGQIIRLPGKLDLASYSVAEACCVISRRMVAQLHQARPAGFKNVYDVSQAHGVPVLPRARPRPGYVQVPAARLMTERGSGDGIEMLNDR